MHLPARTNEVSITHVGARKLPQAPTLLQSLRIEMKAEKLSHYDTETNIAGCILVHMQCLHQTENTDHAELVYS